MKNTLFVTIFLCLFLVNSCSRNDNPSSGKPQAIVSFVKNVEGSHVDYTFTYSEIKK